MKMSITFVIIQNVMIKYVEMLFSIFRVDANSLLVWIILYVFAMFNLKFKCAYPNYDSIRSHAPISSMT